MLSAVFRRKEMPRLSYEATVRSCFAAYIVQAIINNFVPLLFVTFSESFGIGLGKITLLITFNFTLQLVVDFVSAYTVDRIGYRKCMIAAHFFSALGLFFLAVLPFILSDAFTALLISVAVYALGGGLIEVLVSPIVEACPTKNKEREMSMLHSFYCWGFVGVILISTLFFHLFGTGSWRVMTLLWMIVPLANMISFFFVPIYDIVPEGEKKMGTGNLFSRGIFWLFLLMMIASGASEQAVGQWASAFAETGLGVSKTAGDLAGPCLFAFMQGLSRVFYGKYGDRINLRKMMETCAVLCIAGYLMTSLSPHPVISLAGCALCGFSVGLFWPGTFSIAAGTLPAGGTMMFAFLALAGDAGCSLGPTLAGFVSEAAGGELSSGILAAIVFPCTMLAALLILRKYRRL